ncbi:MAG: DUF2029 domain-containing protein [Bacteroidales bacterium]|nr:DUF2029 domain-containing protein [Bacteroidales bacterium]
MTDIFKHNIFKFLFLLLIFIAFGIILLNSETSVGGADEFQHFLISKYSFTHHKLFFDHWGKPLYTILASPFAQFDLFGVRILNVILGLLTAFFSCKIAEKLEIKNFILTTVLVVFTPIYAVLMLSGMTEILFSFVIVLSIYLFIKERFIWSAIVVSFLIFVRNEGIVVQIIFTAAYVLKKQFKALPFIVFAYVFFSVVGMFIFDDFLWIIHQFPYRKKSPVYGHGDLLHFVNNSRKIFGLPITFLTLIGIVIVLIETIKTVIKKEGNFFKSKNFNFILIIAILLGYFAAHSFVWWKGLGGSLGLIRVIAGVSPLATIISLKPINYLTKKFNKKYVTYLLTVILSFILINDVFNIYSIPAKFNREELAFIQATEFINTEYKNETVYYFFPYFAYFYNEDPFENPKLKRWQLDYMKIQSDVKEGEIIIWDAHYAQNEGRIKLEYLTENPSYELIYENIPKPNIKTLNNYDFSIKIFRKTKVPEYSDSLLVENKIDTNDFKNIQILKYYKNSNISTSEVKHDSSVIFASNAEFMFNTFIDFNKYPHSIDSIHAHVSLCLEITDFESNNLRLVFQIKDKNENNYYYKAYKINEFENVNTCNEQFYNIQLDIDLSRIKNKEDIASLYLWNYGRQEQKIDNFLLFLYQE